jgi:hypothetical protein
VSKFIFWIVVVFGVLLGLRLLNVAAAKKRVREARGAASKAAAPGETMVRCARCGVFLPRGDARPVADGYVCGDAACAPRG